VVEGIIYRLRTGIAWRDLPASFEPWQTVWKRHQRSRSTVPGTGSTPASWPRKAAGVRVNHAGSQYSTNTRFNTFAPDAAYDLRVGNSRRTIIRLREPCRNHGRLRCPCLHPACPEAACQDVDRRLNKPTVCIALTVKVCKSDCEGTVAGTRGNGEVAPIPAVHITRTGRLKSTQGGALSDPAGASASRTISSAARVDGSSTIGPLGDKSDAHLVLQTSVVRVCSPWIGEVSK
jgi:transposase